MKKLYIGFVGFGLIGGSIARNLRRLYPDATIVAYNYNPDKTNPNLLLAKEEGTLSTIVTTFDEIFPLCDIIFLCAPVLKNIDYLCQLKGNIKPECILTDVGSVKGNIHTAVKENNLEANFIGGHPMTGSEKTGYENSSMQLMENAFYILTPTAQTRPDTIAKMEQLVTSLGAIPVTLSPDNHDSIVAAISHVPHIIAAALVNMVQDADDAEEHMRALAAGGFKDITRIASSSPVMWENICLTNAVSISSFIDTYIDYLSKMKQAIQKQDRTYIMEFFQKSKDYRDSIPSKPIGILKKIYQLHIDVPDRKGAIATIATILASHDISIKNIGIAHNREDIIGVLYIDFYDEAAMEHAQQILLSHNYTVHPLES